MTQPIDEVRREAEEPEQDFTICPHCGEELPHHDCQNDQGTREEF